MTVKNGGKFSKENQPKIRGKRSKEARTFVLEALKRASSSEDGFWDLLIARAIGVKATPDSEAQASDPICMKEVLMRLAPLHKPTLPKIEFEFDEDADPLTQAGQVLKAAADGVMPPDVAHIFVSSISSMMKIEEITDISKRLTDIEKALKIDA